MLNMIVAIDCDLCGHYFEQVALAVQPEQNAQAVKLLTSLVQEDGWHAFHHQYRCPDCVLEAAGLATH